MANYSSNLYVIKYVLPRWGCVAKICWEWAWYIRKYNQRLLTYRLSAQGETSEEISVGRMEILAYSTNDFLQKLHLWSEDEGCKCCFVLLWVHNFTRVFFFAVQNFEGTILVLMLVFVRSSPSSRIFKSILKRYITTIIDIPNVLPWNSRYNALRNSYNV